ncbi:helix-turn-helix transcriptional regulator [Streptomyces sp. Q6]|uniref:Helix-turn-helix transcriptional regulator n=1 Tax=Streptomyces citrinus TaxID=3118173 RepID=A0ACD5AF34_9ACTN
MDRDWVRLGNAFRTDRERQSLKQKDVAAALGAALTSIQDIERGHKYTKPTRTIRAYATLLGWSPDSVDSVLAGGDVSRAAAAPAPADERPADTDIDGRRLPLRIVHELGDEGELLDTAVLKVGDKGRAIIVVKGDPGVTADELIEELRAWQRSRARLESGDDTGTSESSGGS